MKGADDVLMLANTRGRPLNVSRAFGKREGKSPSEGSRESGLFEVVLSPLIVLFGHVLEAKTALLASSQSFQADQESRKLGMARLL